MKMVRCTLCEVKNADRKFGRRNFCSDCYKNVRRYGAKHIIVSRRVNPREHGMANFPFQVYRDTVVKVH